jgi:hypothetical protein
LISFFKQIVFFSSLLCASQIAVAATLYVVVSDNLRGTSFSSAEVRRILLGEITSLQNKRVRLIYPSYSSDEIVTLSKFVGKGGSVRNLKSYWSKMIFTGRGNPPDTADDDSDLKRLLTVDNAIGVTQHPTGMNVVYTISE